MMMRKMSAVLAAIWLLLGSSSSAQAAEVEADRMKLVTEMANMFGTIDLTDTPVLSPDGNHIAMRVFRKDHSEVHVLAITENGLVPKMMSKDSEGERFTKILWASSDRLLVGILQWSKKRRLLPRAILIAMDVDGGNPLVVLEPKKKRVSGYSLNYNPRLDRVASVLPNDPDHILMLHGEEGFLDLDVYKVNIHTSERVLYEELPEEKGSYQFYFDASGKARVGFLSRYRQSGRMIIKQPDGEWRSIDNPDVFEDGRFRIAGFSEDPNFLYVTSSYATGRNALFKFDLTTASLAKKIYEHDKVDVAGVFLSPGTAKPVAVHWLDDQIEMKFFDRDYARLFGGIRKSINKPFRLTSMSLDEKYAIVSSSGPQEPGVYYLLDRENGKMDPLHYKSGHIDMERLQATRPIRYEARDALEINAYVTYPDSGTYKGKFPLIVLPHGGPIARDYLRWDSDVQFLSNLGYAVLQPNFRGSAGYGSEFIDKGDNQWADGMLNDMIDGVEYLADQGKIDPSRVCIVGYSYGGYAALMSSVKHSSVYRCAASFAGISDIKMMLKTDGAYDRKYYWYKRVAGDRKYSKLKEISPITFVKKLDIPVLLGHGGKDTNVIPKQSEKFFKKAKSANKTISYIAFPEEGHGLRDSKNRIDWYTKLGAFLMEHNPPNLVPKDSLVLKGRETDKTEKGTEQ